ncbi:hypothetical protein Tco_0483957 [Tanacetum coccineum]
MAYSSKGKNLSKLVVTDEMIDYVLAKYENKWRVDDAIVEVILDDLLQKAFNEPELVKDDKVKGTGFESSDHLENKIQNVEEVLYKAKDK